MGINDFPWLSILKGDPMSFQKGQKRTNQCSFSWQQTGRICLLNHFSKAYTTECVSLQSANGTPQFGVWSACLVYKCAKGTRLSTYSNGDTLAESNTSATVPLAGTANEHSHKGPSTHYMKIFEFFLWVKSNTPFSLLYFYSYN